MSLVEFFLISVYYISYFDTLMILFTLFTKVVLRSDPKNFILDAPSKSYTHVCVFIHRIHG